MDPLPSEYSGHRNSVRVSRAWYSASIAEFLAAPFDRISGQLSSNCESHQLRETQRVAWRYQIEFLREHLTGVDGMLFFEFSIPRMGSRIDCVLVIGGVVFVIEFKVGQSSFNSAAIDQVWDYALDLKNFHEASHSVSIVPILIPTDTRHYPPLTLRHADDLVYEPVPVHPDRFRLTLETALNVVPGELLHPDEWAQAPYRPTPTILEAARALYSRHSVAEITRRDASARNLGITSRCVEHLVTDARTHRRKLICFVTGVPGAGKTLVGLNIATQHRADDEPTHAVFLSGNGPLVAVLKEALARDDVARSLASGNGKASIGEARKKVKSFVQIVHHFRDEAVRDKVKPPPEHLAIFDEAQRAWTLRKTSNFMKLKKGISDFAQSEPEFLISYMDRHTDWAAIICLVGGGQEINTGEAGIDAWIDAVRTRFPHWDMAISSRLTDTEYIAGRALELIRSRPNTVFHDELHLGVSMRSFRAETVSGFVKAVLDCEVAVAREMFKQLSGRYQIVVTRDLDAAKAWIRQRARGTQRYGLMASSRARRLKPHAIDVRFNVDPVHYFLNEKDDIRSSYHLEDAASEFQVQGLELDWVCVAWDGDFRHNGSGWSYYEFPRGDRWTNVRNEDNRRYLKNAYRVLLTRARQGMVIFIPPGDAADPSRAYRFYDPTFRYLTDIGVPVIG